MVNAAISNTDINVVAAVFERLPHGVSVLWLEDENDLGSFRFVEANAAASRQSGVDQAGVIGTTIHESFPELLQTDWPERYLEAIRSGESVLIGEVEYPDRDVSEDHFTVTAVPLGGRYVAILSENSSLRRRLQDDLLEKTAEAARLQMLNETALTMAHHIRNALTPISLLADLYDGSNIRAADELKRITTDQSDRIAAMVDALVEMSKQEIDSTTPHPSQKRHGKPDVDDLIEKHLERRRDIMEPKRSGNQRS